METSGAGFRESKARGRVEAESHGMGADDGRSGVFTTILSELMGLTRTFFALLRSFNRNTGQEMCESPRWPAYIWAPLTHRPLRSL